MFVWVLSGSAVIPINQDYSAASNIWQCSVPIAGPVHVYFLFFFPSLILKWHDTLTQAFPSTRVPKLLATLLVSYF